MKFENLVAKGVATGVFCAYVLLIIDGLTFTHFFTFCFILCCTYSESIRRKEVATSGCDELRKYSDTGYGNWLITKSLVMSENLSNN